MDRVPTLPEADARKQRSIVPWLVVGGALSIAGILLATRGIDVGEVGSAISDATPLWLILGALAILASYPLLALRWRIIATDLGPPAPSKMVELEFIGAAVNNALPLRLGEIARSVGLARESSRPVLQAFGTVVVDRVADVVFFAVAFGATVAVSPTPGWVQWVGVVGAILTVVAVAAIGLISLFLWRYSEDTPPDTAIRRHLLTLAEGLRCVRTPGIFWRSLALTVAAWGVWMLGAWLVGESLGIGLSPSELLFVTGLLGLGSAVPSAPGFIGTYHWIAASAVGLFGVGSSDALAFAVLLHAAWFVPTTLVGTVLMVRWGLNFAALRRTSVARPVQA